MGRGPIVPPGRGDDGAKGRLGQWDLGAAGRLGRGDRRTSGPWARWAASFDSGRPILASMETLAVAQLKGGSGKTTLAVGLAAVLAGRGLRVLVADLDPQGNAGMVLSGGELSPTGPTMGDVLTGGNAILEAARPSTVAGVDLVPAGRGLADVAVRLGGEIGRERRLRLALAAAGDRWDVCLLDTPPTLGVLLVNALNAAAGVVVPTDPGVFCLAGLSDLLGVVEQVGRYLDARGLAVRRLVLSRVRRDLVSRQVAGQLRDRFGALVAAAELPASVKVEESHSRCLPVPVWSPRCPVSVALSILADELFPCLQSRRVA